MAFMKAGVAGPDGLQITEIARPEPGPGQVLVKVAAAGMNRADLNAAKGSGVASPDSFGRAIGMEWSGIVTSLGSGVEGFREGDAVMCSGTGGYAEYAVADARRCIQLDSEPDMVQAACMPLALMTAHDALITRGQLSPGGSVLIAGAASAVGQMTIKIALVRGAKLIVALARDADRRARLLETGATHVFDPSDSNLVDQVLEATSGTGVDTAIDMVSGSGVNQLMRMTAIRGRIVNVGRLGGTNASFDFDLHAARRLEYIGVTFRTRTADEVATIVSLMQADLWPAMQAGKLNLPIEHRFELTEAKAAHELMAANKHFGKIALIP